MRFVDCNYGVLVDWISLHGMVIVGTGNALATICIRGNFQDFLAGGRGGAARARGLP